MADSLKGEIANQLAKLSPFDIAGDKTEESFKAKLEAQIGVATEIEQKSTKLIGKLVQSHRAVCWFSSI